MTTSIRYTGTTQPFFEITITGKARVWALGQQQDVSDSDAAALVTAGGFAPASPTRARSAAQLGLAPSASDIALDGEFFLYTDPTQRYVINAAKTAYVGAGGGGGSSAFSALTGVYSDNTNLNAAIGSLVPNSVKGAANGVASLDGTGKVPTAQLPAQSTAWGAVTGTLASQTDLQAALDAKEGTNAPVTLTAATNLTRAAHANRQIIFNGANATLTVQAEATGLTSGDDYFEVHTLAASAGVPTLSTPDGKTITGSATKIIGVTRKGVDLWTAGTTDPAAAGGTGTVTSINASSGGTYAAALTVTGGPVTSTGSLTITPNVCTTTTPGVVPAPGSSSGRFLKDDLTWAAASGSGTVLDIACGSSFRIQCAGPGLTTVHGLGNSGTAVVGTLVARTAVITGVGYKNRAGVAGAAAANSNAYISTATATPPFIMPDTATTWIPQPFRCVGVVSDALSACRTGFGLFAGVPSATAEPSALLNGLFFGADSTDTQLTFMHNNGSGTATKEVLNSGAGFPCNTTNADVYECYIRLNGGTTPSVDYYIINRVTGVKASGNVTTKLPVAATAFNAGMYRNTAANTTAANIDMIMILGGLDAQMGATS